MSSGRHTHGQQGAKAKELAQQAQSVESRKFLTVGGLQVGIAGCAVGGRVVTEVEEKGEHL